MGWRTYGEVEPAESPMAEFFCWFFMVGVGVPVSYGWIFVAVGWLDNITLLEISGTLGVLVGLRQGWESMQRKKRKDRL